MNNLNKHLKTIQNLKRKKYHPIIHEVHKTHKISKKTLFYVKEYGPHTHAFKTIIKESIKILLFASLISSFGGIALEQIKPFFISLFPLIILLPVLNGMLGNYGTIISSKISTLIHEGKIKNSKKLEIKVLFNELILISIITTFLSVTLAFLISLIFGYPVTLLLFLKIMLITLIDIFFIMIILFSIAIFSGLYFYKKKEDPNNFLIPITTSIADFGNMVLLFLLIILFF